MGGVTAGAVAQTATPTEPGITGPAAGAPWLVAGLIVLAIAAIVAGGSNWEAVSPQRGRWVALALLLVALVALLL